MSVKERSLASLPKVERLGWPWSEACEPLQGDWPRITVVTPSFQQGRFIEETIRSVLLQGYPNLQYIVMDGGSKDETVSVLEKYGPFIDYWATERDRGQTHAIAKGLARADGEIFGWLNSDDIYAPGALKRAGELLRAGTGNRWIAGACRWKYDDEDGEVKPSRVNAELFEWMLTSPIQQPASLWRTELFRDVGTLDESLRYVMDHDLFLQFHLAGVPAFNLDDELATLRLHRDSKTVAMSPAFRRETITKVLPRYLQRLPPEQMGQLRREVSLKLLRNARASWDAGDVAGVAKNVGEAARWSAQRVFIDGVRFAVREMREALRG